MKRAQIILTDDQDSSLESVARRLRTSKTELVRQGVDFVLSRARSASPDSLLDLVGQAGRVGRRDVAARHDRYLVGKASKRRR